MLYESLKVDFSKQTKVITDKWIVDLSSPDPTGKQYPVKESTTTASKQEQERTEIREVLLLTMQQFSSRLDTISNKVNVLMSQKETVVELSWWNIHKDKVYCTIIILLIIIFFALLYKK
jgi:hypothetical protein|nr:histidine kinase [Bacteroides sp.]